MTIKTTDRLDIALSVEDGDLDIAGGVLNYAVGPDGVAQGVDVTLSMAQGEWSVALEKGVPYHELLGEKFSEETALRIFREAALRSEGVIEVRSMTVVFNPLTRLLDVDADLKTEFGDIVVGFSF